MNESPSPSEDNGCPPAIVAHGPAFRNDISGGADGGDILFWGETLSNTIILTWEPSMRDSQFVHAPIVPSLLVVGLNAQI